MRTATQTPAVQLHLPDMPPPRLAPTEAEVLSHARRLWWASVQLRQRYPQFDALLAHPQHGHWLLMCARGALQARRRRRV